MQTTKTTAARSPKRARVTRSTVASRPAPTARPAFASTHIERYKNDMARLCFQNKVKSLYAFGSVLTSRFGNDSDIDLVVDIDSTNPLEYADCYFNLKFALQDLFSRPVDLLESRAIRNNILRREIDKTKELIYAKE